MTTDEGEYQVGKKPGLVEVGGKTDLALEFMMIGKDYDDALGRCVLLDNHQKTAVIKLKAHLDMFTKTKLLGVQHLTNFLNASPAVGGFNRALAAQVGTGIIAGAEALGVSLSKKEAKEANKQIELANKARRYGDREHEPQENPYRD